MSLEKQDVFTLRWGIIGTGLIASWFVSDLVLDPSTHRNEPNLIHKVQAIGSSSYQKGTAFAQKHIPSTSTSNGCSIYDSYAQVYTDPAVDIVYIATPTGLHFTNALDAILAGKHVLCEKPMTITASESEQLIAAARAKGVFLMEALWTRFFPIAKELQRALHEKKLIGDITRVFVDFGLDMPLEKQRAGSRLVDLRLGAGCLLDIGIYALTWARMALCGAKGDEGEEPAVRSAMVLKEGVDEEATVLLIQQKTGRQAVCSASYRYKSGKVFGRVEGSEGCIEIVGGAASKPESLVIRRKDGMETVQDFSFVGWGFFYEADAVAMDIRDGRTENETMPLEETVRVMRIMDEVRRQNGMKYLHEE
ncbi:hypothetical protein VE01_02280 [Pseudogymnoascus verrucosus]|uniref:D-xylose 1-dehydrogenase (NADP(+), D-xylono-1,5-lactone-forming) n=1 Tax=Pseudogymnoascus verrucosus TaxID=342668 RepID=A0A1B8GTE8_9PEZI|nr:uncharacterized protein VE01_02280 [Pseudogymnoascus verrucosus]OBT99112.1 hypothetical protein VE01_02280 [Pseudogymnoascus verrucosus]